MRFYSFATTSLLALGSGCFEVTPTDGGGYRVTLESRALEDTLDSIKDSGVLEELVADEGEAPLALPYSPSSPSPKRVVVKNPVKVYAAPQPKVSVSLRLGKPVVKKSHRHRHPRRRGHHHPHKPYR